MKISTEFSSLSKHIGEERAVEEIAKAGFDAWDFSICRMFKYDWENEKVVDIGHPLVGADYLKHARKLRHIGEECGIVCNQSHAPFPTRNPQIRSYFKRAIECTAEAGGEICIIHPDNDKSAEENAEMYLELLPFAKECGVKIAAENMWNWDEREDHASFAACATPESFVKHLDVVDDDFLVACLDIGHAEMKGCGSNAVSMIHALGPRLKALHIHDNDCIHDSHQIPFSMKIDFERVVKALKEINYDGYFTLEADAYLSSYDKDTAVLGIKKLAESVRRLADMFENC